MARFICDLHIHSRYAQGCSKDITVPTLEKWARVKGIDVLGTGDFCHPEWIRELKETLVTEKDGIYYTATGQAFVLQVELSLIYTQGRGRRVHVVVLAPSFAAVDRITEYLLRHGRVDYDGRPIFKIPASQLVKDLRAIDGRIEVIPAHAWTPWFSLFGSFSGFDSFEECFGDQSPYVHAIETGLSSDVEMNDRLDQLKGVRYVSFSDSHSYWPWRLGREATIFDLDELSYDAVIGAIRTGKGFFGTIEVDPAYGKYHLDGHRAHDVVMEPAESRKAGKTCPVCGREMTIGVLHRVEELADRPQGTVPPSQLSHKLLPLHEILSLVLGKAMTTKAVWDEYWRVLAAGRNEYDVLMDVSEEKLLDVTSPEIARAIILVREGKITVKPGYDGVYGVPEFPGLAVKRKAPAGDAASEAPKKRRGRPPKEKPSGTEDAVPEKRGRPAKPRERAPPSGIRAQTGLGGYL